MKKIAGLLIILIATVASIRYRTIRSKTARTSSSPDIAVDSPADLPKSGWKTALKRTKQALKDKNLSVSAAGVAFYATLTFFPALLGVAAIYAVFASPRGLLDTFDELQGFMPEAIHDLITTQLEPLASAGQTSIGIAALVSIAALLWTTSGALQNLVKALNEAYEVKESRGFVKLRAINMVLSVFLLAFGGLILATLVLNGEALRSWGAPAFLADSFVIVRWPVLVVLVSIVLAVIYRYAPDRRQPHWSWVSWGAAAATLIWLAATVLFFVYAQNFGNFNESYGTFAGIIILMTWFNVSALIVLIGAQVNQKLETVTATNVQAE